MNAITIKTVTTADTGETIDGVTVLGDYHMNGGYDWMELIEEHGWAVIPSWGCDGWDLGQWPYVMVAGTRTADSIGNLFGMATYCEGDVTLHVLPDEGPALGRDHRTGVLPLEERAGPRPGRPARSRRRTAQPLPDALRRRGRRLTSTDNRCTARPEPGSTAPNDFKGAST